MKHHLQMEFLLSGYFLKYLESCNIVISSGMTAYKPDCKRLLAPLSGVAYRIFPAASLRTFEVKI
jgi:hypothetical protein